MVLGNYVKCMNCGHEYRIRYNVNNNFPQSASFFCKTCKQSITYGYDGDRKIILENITIVKDPANPEVINLHPELPIDEERQSDPIYFPSLEFMSKTWDKKSLFEFRQTQASMVAYIQEWDVIAEDFRQLSESLWPVLQRKYGHDNFETSNKILRQVIRTADHFLEGKWNDLLKRVLMELATAEKHADFGRLKAYLIGYKNEFLLHRMYQLMKQYRDVETELLSTLLAQKHGRPSKGFSSSAKWDKIERVYGDFYEIYGELMVIPTVLNNMLARNNYEQFATTGFTLEDYLATDKAKRYVNFAANSNLQPLGDYYDASLRNGTHHKTAKINKAKQKIVLKIGKGGKSEKVWSFVEYIEHCNELYARCLILFIVFNKIIS